MNHVIKRSGQSQAFDSRKVHASIYASCLSVHVKAPQAEAVARQVTAELEKWLAKKTEVTTNDIRHQAGHYLSELEPHAGYFYLHHRII